MEREKKRQVAEIHDRWSIEYLFQIVNWTFDR